MKWLTAVLCLRAAGVKEVTLPYKEQLHASTDTGKVLDYEAINKVCHKCSRFSNTDFVAYQTFIANHTCKANYEGSAASMEPTGIKRIYKCSIEKNNLGYTEYLGDGASSSFSSASKG